MRLATELSLESDATFSVVLEGKSTSTVVKRPYRFHKACFAPSLQLELSEAVIEAQDRAYLTVFRMQQVF